MIRWWWRAQLFCRIIWAEAFVKERLAPRLTRTISSVLSKRLVEAHRTYASAGNANGLRWSPFKETCDQLRRFMTTNSPCALGLAIESIQTHYGTTATAASCLWQWAELGKIAGVEAFREGRRRYLRRIAEERR